MVLGVTNGFTKELETKTHIFEPMMSRAHVISTLGGKMRGGADPRGGAGVGYAW